MEPDIEKAMDRCLEDAQGHVIRQHGGGFVLHGIGSSTRLIADPDRHKFVEVIAEIIWAERNGARRKRTSLAHADQPEA